jgi:hypothetical protein
MLELRPSALGQGRDRGLQEDVTCIKATEPVCNVALAIQREIIRVFVLLKSHCIVFVYQFR